MSTLGEILTQLHDREDVIALLAEAGHLKSISGLDAAADHLTKDTCDVALDAVHAFVNAANDEAWVRLMGKLQEAESPAAACLGEMIVWFLAH